jgi:NADPH-dependent curcumin reductase CurA
VLNFCRRCISFTFCSLCAGGKIIVIGMMSQYKAGGDGAADAWTPSEHKGLPEKLLWKSGTCVGFFLPHYAKHFRRHLTRLYALHKSGQLKVVGLHSCCIVLTHSA